MSNFTPNSNDRLSKMNKLTNEIFKVQSFVNGLFISHNIFDRKHTSILAILHYGVGTFKIYGLLKGMRSAQAV